MEILKTADIKIIKQLDDECFNQDAYSLNQYEQMINNYLYFLLKEDNQNIGFVIFLNNLSNEYELIKIGIIPKFRNKGLGFKALDQLFNNHLDYQKVFLEVSNKNISAIKLYEKLNFQVISVRKKYYKDNSDALIMLKEKII